MSLILNIDTATEIGSVCLAKDGHAIDFRRNDLQKNHAAWIHDAIDKMITESGFSIKELEAVSITVGPGSYTGLRVGMATAKGLCFALNIPLITENTLKIMAFAAVNHLKQDHPILCPMVDARRMEVFCALYSNQLDEVISPMAMVLGRESFSAELEETTILFFGNGSIKWRNICFHKNALFESIPYDASGLSMLAHQKFVCGEYSDLAYADPVYLKEFQSFKKPTG